MQNPGAVKYSTTMIDVYSTINCNAGTETYHFPYTSLLSECGAYNDDAVTPAMYEEFSVYGVNGLGNNTFVSQWYYSGSACAGDIVQQDSYLAGACVAGVIYSCGDTGTYTFLYSSKCSDFE